MDLTMIKVGCWLGRLVVDCTLCDWQHPAVDSPEAQESRELPEIIDRAQRHVAEAHQPAARVVVAHPGETWRWPIECERCGEATGPWNPDVPDSPMTHIREDGGANWAANEDHAPVFPGDAHPQDTPPCFSLPPADPQRFSRGSHDG
jgi:hypothetical protein